MNDEFLKKIIMEVFDQSKFVQNYKMNIQQDGKLKICQKLALGRSNWLELCSTKHSIDPGRHPGATVFTKLRLPSQNLKFSFDQFLCQISKQNNQYGNVGMIICQEGRK